MIMSNTLGPLPHPVEVSRKCTVDNGLSITWAYTTAQMEAERLRCYELGVAQERERIKANLLERHAQSAHSHNYYACMAVELFGPLG